MTNYNKKISRRWTALAVLAVLSFFVYGCFIEPRWIEVTNWSRQVGLSGTPIKIAQLSDLHISEIGSTERKTLEHLGSIQAHIILLSGDVIDRSDSLPALKSFLSQLPPAMKFAVLGNWEHWSGVDLNALATLYSENNVTLLVNQCVSITTQGARLSIAGFDDYTAGQPDVYQAFKGCGKDEPIIALEHSPGLFEEAHSPGMRRPAFSVAGHTHGGQLAIGNKAIFTPRGSGRFVAGWYSTSWGDLYVSKGVGTSIIPMRIGARPEIAVFEVN
jgi:predicted MPP superfamily phosphohydrolase